MGVMPSPVTIECEFLSLVLVELQATRAVLEKELPAIRALLRKLQLPAVAVPAVVDEETAGNLAEPVTGVK